MQQQNQNQQMGQTTQNRIPQPPQVITTKDLSYLKDAMSWELDVIKKFHHFAQETMEPKTKNLIKKSAQMHQKHYGILLKHVNPVNSASKLQS